MFKQFLSVICVIFLFLGFAATASAQYVVDLTIPLYGQENSMYGGPACAQMLMNGYPDSYPSIYYPQADIWTSIQSHNSGEPGWSTDPLGMQGALMELNEPQAGIWSIKSYDVREDLMFQVLFWMNYNSYAVTTLVNSGYHWVDIVGYETDIEPVWGSEPELQEITIHDPWPIGVGQVVTMSGTVWYDTKWSNPIGIAGSWYNKYVAVIEPPDNQGTVTIDRVERRGTDLISTAASLQYSEDWITQLNLAAKHPTYSAINKNDTNNLEPLLVREEINFGISKDSRVPYYYIIPYAKKSDNVLSAENPAQSSLWVIVNGFTGDFEEVGSFGRPVKYLSEEDATKAAASALKLEAKEMVANAQAMLVYTPCTITQSRAYPFWKIMFKDTTLYVSQEGKVYKSDGIIPRLYGR